jgi:hypothetical protein
MLGRSTTLFEDRMSPRQTHRDRTAAFAGQPQMGNAAVDERDSDPRTSAIKEKEKK